MSSVEVDAAFAAGGVLARQVLDVVLRTMGNLLAMHADCSVAMHATDVFGSCVKLRYWHLFPAPLVLSIDQVFPSLLAAEH